MKKRNLIKVVGTGALLKLCLFIPSCERNHDIEHKYGDNSQQNLKNSEYTTNHGKEGNYPAYSGPAYYFKSF